MQTTKSESPIPIWIILIAGIAAISTAALFIRLAQTEVPSLVIAAWRLVLAAIVFMPGIWREKASLAALAKRERWLLLLSGGFLAAHFSLWITSLSLTTIASSAVLVTTTPLWTALLSPLVLKEPVKGRTWIGLAIALAGGAIVALQSSCASTDTGFACQLGGEENGHALLGNFLALAGAWMASGYMLVGRIMRRKLGTSLYAGSVYALAGLILVLIVILTRQPVKMYSLPVWGWIILLALIPQVIGHTSFNYALQYVPAVLVTLCVLAEPIGASLLGMLILKEIPGWLEVTGSLIILAGILAAALPGKATIPSENSPG